ncbi:MAG: hypothetical protein Q4P36_03480 [Bowdeniella nasicola]|nr:hypothetical protein [Bowdeniella nasicola]
MAKPMMRLSAGVIAVAAFAAGSSINALLPDREAILTETFPVSGRVGEPVQIRTGTVTVDDVATARTVTRFGLTAQTSAVYLTFTLTYVPNGQEAAVAPVEVVGGNGAVFGGAQPFGGVLACGGSQADLPISCPMAIEVGEEALAGAHVRVYNYSSASGDDVADIDLALNAEEAAELLHSAGTFDVTEPHYGGRPR